MSDTDDDSGQLNLDIEGVQAEIRSTDETDVDGSEDQTKDDSSTNDAEEQTSAAKQNGKNTAQELRSIIDRCRQIMRKDKGLSGELDRLPMLTWIMFLKFLDDREREREQGAKLKGEEFEPIVEPPYRWRDWAVEEDGITGDRLMEFINQSKCTRPDGTEGPGLLEYLSSLDEGTDDSRKQVVGEIFGGINNRMISGYLFRDVVNTVDEIHFDVSAELDVLGEIYETMLQEMRDAAGDSGEFYTPRPVVKFIVDRVDPQLGETVLDPAAGTGGFLVEAFKHLQEQCETVEDYQTLQDDSIRGGEAKPLPYMLGQMNLLLHGLDAPEIKYGNSLNVELTDIGKSDRVDVILTNPPFGGEEEKGIQSGFPKDRQTSETAILFFQLVMRKLRRPGRHSEEGGRAAIVVPDGFLFADGVAAKVKEHLMDNFDLHTVVRLPKGVFEPYTGIKTNLLFFDAAGSTDEVWFYEHPLPEERNSKYTKTNPLEYEEFEPVLDWWDDREETEQSWKVSAQEIEEKGYDLDFKNPNQTEEGPGDPDELLEEYLELNQEVKNLRSDLKSELDRALSREV
jgi:type I restriction enzyme M protein